MGLISEAKLLAGGRDWRGRAKVPRSAERWAPVEQRREFPTEWARSTLAGAVRAGVQRALLKPTVWTQTRPTVVGAEYLTDLTGPVIFIANHASHLDAPLVFGSLPARFAERLAVGAAADYFFDARWRAAVTTLVFNAFPVYRHRSQRARSLAGRLIDESWSLLLFPEGTRSQDGWMNSFQLGAAQLCVHKGVPAVPIALRGTFGAMPRGRNWPRPGRPKVVVRYGRPLRPRDGENAAAFKQRMLTAVAQLWAEEEIGWYTAMRSAAAGTLVVPKGPPEPRALPAGSPESASESVPAATAAAAHGSTREAAHWRRIWESTRPLGDERPRPVWPD